MIFLDLETTGLSFNNDYILEFGAIKTNDDLQEIGSLQLLFTSPIEIPAKVSEKNGITMDILEGAGEIEEQEETIRLFLGTEKCIGHNIKNFDAKFLRRYNILWNNELVDTLEIAKKNVSTAKHSLDFLCEYFDIIRPKHRALDDCRATIELYKRLIN